MRWLITLSIMGTCLATLASPAEPSDPRIPGIPTHEDNLPAPVPLVVHDDEGQTCLSGGGLEIRVKHAPFSVRVTRGSDGEELLQSAASSECMQFAPVSFADDLGFTWNRFYPGYRGYCSLVGSWSGALRVASHRPLSDRYHFLLTTSPANRDPILFVVGPFYPNAVRLAAATSSTRATFRRLGFTFVSPQEERYAGFGERFNGIDQRGKIVRCWAEEGGIEPGCLRRFWPFWSPEHTIPGGEDATYAPMPFFLSNRGYGILAGVAEPTRFDMARSVPDRWRIEAETDHLSLIVFAGPTPAAVIGQFTERVGRVQIPRPWVFAPWNMLEGYREGDLLRMARLFREKDIPSSVAPQWHSITPVPSWRGREDAQHQSNAQLHALGFKSLCYLQPHVDKRAYPDLWEDGNALGNFVQDKSGKTYDVNVFVNVFQNIRYRVGLIDFTREGVDVWWHRQLRKLIDLGFDGAMYDFGEYVPPDARFADGCDGHYWHNAYSLLYLRSAFRFFQQLDENPNDGIAPDYVYFHRCGYVGSQRWAWAMWSGDPEADWSPSDGLAAQVCAGINVGLSGIPFWGSDTAGFHAILVDPPTSELYKRWIQFAAFSGLMRDMSNDEIRGARRIRILDEPELTAIARRYQKLRTQLVPYIVNAAREARATGLPLMRAAFLGFPNDPVCWELKHEYLFGPDLYVAPVIEPGARQRNLYLPPGQWIPLWDKTEYDTVSGGFRIGGVPVTGGRKLAVDAPIEQIPVFVRLGAVIPVGDPRIDTWAPATSNGGAPVTTSDDVKHVLHVWAFPHGDSSTTLSDGSVLNVTVTKTGIVFERHAQQDAAELVAQVVWPANLPAPKQIAGLSLLPDADSLALPPGSWTFDSERHAAAFHGRPRQNRFTILAED